MDRLAAANAGHDSPMAPGGVSEQPGLQIVDTPPDSRPLWLRWLCGAIVCFFAAKALFLALSIGPVVFPDETTHFGKTLVFAASPWLPTDSPATHHLGLIEHTPRLYYFVMGKMLAMNITPLPDLIYVRLLNVLLTVLTVVLAVRWVRMLGFGPQAEVLFTVLITHTLMFTFISAAVNPDNLVNLLAIAALLSLFSWFNSRAIRHLLLFVIWIGLGALTKSSYLPLAAALVLVFLVREFGSFRLLAKQLTEYYRPRRITGLVLGAFCMLVLSLNVTLYGGNLLQYGKLEPNVGQVLQLQEAMTYRIFAQEHVVSEYRRGRISYEEALNRAMAIPHYTDRAGALTLLSKAAKDKEEGIARVNRFRYAAVWSQMMLGRMYGILAHRLMIKTGDQLKPYYGVFLIALGLLLLNIRGFEMNGHGIAVAFVFIFYALVLMQLVNYDLYYSFGLFTKAVQGRYLFPVLAPLYALLTAALMCPGSQRVRWLVAVLVGSIFVYGEFPFFLQNVTTAWYFQT